MKTIYTITLLSIALFIPFVLLMSYIMTEFMKIARMAG